MAQPTCQTCRFMRTALNNETKNITSYCCINAPAAQMINTGNGAIVLPIQPPIPPSNYCGRWEMERQQLQ